MIIYAFTAIGLFTFIVWGLDKYRAVRHHWRIPERMLLTLVVFGGSFGALAGMLVFRHKTRKTGFWIVVLLCLAIHSLLIARFAL